MASTLYTHHADHWLDMEAIIATARDWQAAEIVLVGKISPTTIKRLQEQWAEYQIPISVGDFEIGDVLPNPPFLGHKELSQVVHDLLEGTEETGEVVIENDVLKSFQTVERSIAL